MDINGAKALKRRLGPNAADLLPPASVDVDVPAHAPPVFHWLGVSQSASETPAADTDDDVTTSASLFRRVGMSFR